jgi:hypothetical protein
VGAGTAKDFGCDEVRRTSTKGEKIMLLLVIILILFFGFGGGWYGYRQYDNSPYHGGGFGLGTILVILLILYLLGFFGGGRLHF